MIIGATGTKDSNRTKSPLDKKRSKKNSDTRSNIIQFLRSIWPGVRDENERRNEMPKGYERMRDSFIKDGMSTKAAKAKAAKIWNAKHKGTGKTVGRGQK